MSQIFEYVLRKNEDVMSQLRLQTDVVSRMIQPHLRVLEENRQNRHVIQEENERLITVTQQLHQQIPCIVRDAIRSDPRITSIPLVYMNTTYLIHIKWLNLTRK